MKLNILLCITMYTFLGLQGAQKVSAYDASINIEKYKQYPNYRGPYDKHCMRVMIKQAWRSALFDEIGHHYKDLKGFQESCEFYSQYGKNFSEQEQFYAATEHGDVVTCKALIQVNPDILHEPLYIPIDTVVVMPLTPLLLVITRGLLTGTCGNIKDYESLLELFIQNKINLTHDASHRNPLLLAYQFGTRKMEIMLLRAGVTLGDRTSFLSGGNQVLRQAICERNLELLKLVLDAGAQVDTIHRYDQKYYSTSLAYLINQYICSPDRKISTIACASELPLIEELLVREANTQDLYMGKERTYTFQKLSEKFTAIRAVVKSAAQTRDARAAKSAAQLQKVLTESFLIADLAKLCAEYIWMPKHTQVQ